LKCALCAVDFQTPFIPLPVLFFRALPVRMMPMRLARLGRSHVSRKVHTTAFKSALNPLLRGGTAAVTAAAVVLAAAVRRQVYRHDECCDCSAAPAEVLVSPSTRANHGVKETLVALLLTALQWLRGGVRSLTEGVRILQRTGYLACIFAPSVLTSPVLLLSDEQSPAVKWWWSLLRDCIRWSGPCNIKFSQWIATRPDLFPLVMCQQLQDLQTNAIRHSWKATRATLTDMFGPDWDGIFSLELDPASGEPTIVGSGCVAQVLRGRMRAGGAAGGGGGGAEVAVKVIHPTVAKSIEDDIRIMRFVTHWLEKLPRLCHMGLTESVEEFSLFMNSQLDLRREAAALARFRKNFNIQAGDGSSDSKGKKGGGVAVTFPEPLYPHVTRLALVETFAEGELILDLLGRIDAQTRHELATSGLDAILKMVFQDNFIHADMHMGNLICQSLDGGGLRLTMIDAGLTAELEAQDRVNFIDLFKAVVLNDGRRVGRLIIERSRNLGACIDPEGFEKELDEVVRTVHASGLSLGRIGVGALLQRVLVACYRHNVRLESKFVSVVLAIGVVEGLGRRLDPDVDILRKAAPYVLQAWREEGRKRAEEGRRR